MRDPMGLGPKRGRDQPVSDHLLLVDLTDQALHLLRVSLAPSTLLAHLTLGA